MNNKTKEILVTLAKRHGITFTQAEDILTLTGKYIHELISNPDKKTNNLYDLEKFPVIHIDNFGKFKPNKRKIRFANYCLEKKSNNKDHEHNI